MAVPTSSGFVTTSSLGVRDYSQTDVSYPNVAAIAALNYTLLQAAIGTNGGDPITIQFTSGKYYPIAGTLDVPCNRSITFDFNGVGFLSQSQSGSPLFRLTMPDQNGWQEKSLVFKNGTLAVPKNVSAIVTDNTGPYDPRFHTFLFEDMKCYGWSEAVATYMLDLTTDYSVMPTIRRCESFTQGVIRWVYGRLEPHATSILVIEQCRSHVAASVRFAPDYYLSGHRNLHMRNTIFEGEWGYNVAATPATYDNCVGLYIDNPGPQTTVISQCWPESWGTRPDSTWYQMVINSPWGSAAGANQPRQCEVASTNGTLLVKNNPASLDPFFVRVRNSPGIEIGRSGPVEVIQDYAAVVDFLNPDPDVRSSRQLESPFRVGWYEAVSQIIYQYPGASGNDGGGLVLNGSSASYPHRHPVYGSCLAFRGMSHRYTLPVSRRVDGKRVYTQLAMCSPHHRRQGGSTDNLYLQISSTGNNQFRYAPDGFIPLRTSWSNRTDSSDGKLLYPYDWFDGAQGPAYHIPASPWVLIFGCTISYYLPGNLDYLRTPVTFFEDTPEGGPPLGTYGRGDRCIGATRTQICTRAGTSRPLSFMATTVANSATLSTISGLANLLEGDWIIDSQSRYARIMTINSNNTITLDRAMLFNRTGTSFTNYLPQWKVE